MLLVAVAFFFAATTTTHANDSTPRKNSNKALHSEVVSLLGAKFPSYLGSTTETRAMVSFIINNKNEVVVVSVKGNDQLDRYVKKKLNYQIVKVKGVKKGKVYRLPLTIKQS